MVNYLSFVYKQQGTSSFSLFFLHQKLHIILRGFQEVSLRTIQFPNWEFTWEKEKHRDQASFTKISAHIFKERRITNIDKN